MVAGHPPGPAPRPWTWPAFTWCAPPGSSPAWLSSKSAGRGKATGPVPPIKRRLASTPRLAPGTKSLSVLKKASLKGGRRILPSKIDYSIWQLQPSQLTLNETPKAVGSPHGSPGKQKGLPHSAERLFLSCEESNVYCSSRNIKHECRNALKTYALYYSLIITLFKGSDVNKLSCLKEELITAFFSIHSLSTTASIGKSPKMGSTDL